MVAANGPRASASKSGGPSAPPKQPPLISAWSRLQGQSSAPIASAPPLPLRAHGRGAQGRKAGSKPGLIAARAPCGKERGRTRCGGLYRDVDDVTDFAYVVLVVGDVLGVLLYPLTVPSLCPTADHDRHRLVHLVRDHQPLRPRLHQLRTTNPTASVRQLAGVPRNTESTA